MMASDALVHSIAVIGIRILMPGCRPFSKVIRARKKGGRLVAAVRPRPRNGPNGWLVASADCIYMATDRLPSTSASATCAVSCLSLNFVLLLVFGPILVSAGSPPPPPPPLPPPPALRCTHTRRIHDASTHPPLHRTRTTLTLSRSVLFFVLPYPIPLFCSFCLVFLGNLFPPSAP
ncbi:hypothetical protein B0J13DRAFT_71869 [Dactylonectria estremocensis]|uniref:Uncharacterized protein n=1 Tax=Dactylonectria estremocensis TaxID=1079267 RepID=A0A9P9J0L3_9HYPO|nr:hypothetical protein B0J13DRAFT_71869 [Dactylonectria estremocensis]